MLQALWGAHFRNIRFMSFRAMIPGKWGLSREKKLLGISVLIGEKTTRVYRIMLEITLPGIVY